MSDTLLFPASTGRISTQQNEQSLMEKARKLAKILDLDFRMCRRTFSTLIRADVKDTAEMLGHSDAKMTLEHHKKAIPERQSAAVEELDRRISVQ